MKALYITFVSKLKKQFGGFDKKHRRFTKSSNSEIARELGYSDAQFSRLINESATEGEYQRAIQNIDRILQIDLLQREIKKDDSGSKSVNAKRWKWASIALLVVLVSLVYYNFKNSSINGENTTKYDMLIWSFESSFVNPYIKLDDLPDDCAFPCYRYQGRWELKNGYKIPFFRERSGFHYVATEVVMYARCMDEKDSLGRLIEGYEYQKHEIWYDQRELPIDSFIDPSNNNLTLKSYQEKDFKKDPNFILVALVHTFLRNEFSIEEDRIVRTGKVIGRNLEFTTSEQLMLELNNKEKVRRIQNELKFISTNRLKDFSRPIECEDADLPNSNYNLITDGDEISFSCVLTTSHVPIEYNKTYRLVDQFIKTSCRTE